MCNERERKKGKGREEGAKGGLGRYGQKKKCLHEQSYYGKIALSTSNRVVCNT